MCFRYTLNIEKTFFYAKKKAVHNNLLEVVIISAIVKLTLINNDYILIKQRFLSIKLFNLKFQILQSKEL